MVSDYRDLKKKKEEEEATKQALQNLQGKVRAVAAKVGELERGVSAAQRSAETAVRQHQGQLAAQFLTDKKKAGAELAHWMGVKRNLSGLVSQMEFRLSNQSIMEGLEDFVESTKKMNLASGKDATSTVDDVIDVQNQLNSGNFDYTQLGKTFEGTQGLGIGGSDLVGGDGGGDETDMLPDEIQDELAQMMAQQMDADLLRSSDRQGDPVLPTATTTTTKKRMVKKKKAPTTTTTTATTGKRKVVKKKKKPEVVVVSETPGVAEAEADPT